MLSKDAQKFLDHSPTLIGIVAGVEFYEHPLYGDEAPLVAITPSGKKKRTDFWDLPEPDDAIELE